jgi:class 3 adenylate cyclase
MVALPPKTRYANSGGVRIAYQVVGDGPSDVVFVPGFVSNVDQYWESPRWTALFGRLASFARLVLWDKRGTGLSDPVGRVPTLDERVDDLQAVMDATACERGALFGASEGGPMALLYASSRPERATALVLYGATPRFMRAPDWPWGWSVAQYTDMLAEVDRDWGQGALFDHYAASCAHDPVAREQFGRYQRASASCAMARAVLEAFALTDCRHIVPAVRVPTLLLHRTDDRWVSVEAARWMAEHIIDARLVEFPGQDHSISVGDNQPILDEVEQFLTGTPPHPHTDRFLATVLFTDIVASTAHAAEMGDRRWGDLLQDHHRLVRRQLERFEGREVKTLGDGFLATFAAPSRAIACACAIRDGVHQLGIDVRAGLHTGECEVVEGDVGGLAVHIGARVAALAGPHEVVVSSTVKDLVAGSDVGFTSRGTHELRGVPGEWRLFTVNN